jgi:hypothetical protein
MRSVVLILAAVFIACDTAEVGPPVAPQFSWGPASVTLPDPLGEESLLGVWLLCENVDCAQPVVALELRPGGEYRFVSFQLDFASRKPTSFCAAPFQFGGRWRLASNGDLIFTPWPDNPAQLEPFSAHVHQVLGRVVWTFIGSDVQLALIALNIAGPGELSECMPG